MILFGHTFVRDVVLLMNYVAIFFIILQSLLEWGIYVFDLVEVKKGGPILNVLSTIWIGTFFYTFAFYAAAAFTNPGYINFSWLRDVQKYPNFKEELDENGEKCFCESCNMPRPLRAHHCSICRKCVLLMDHHCDFIGNCVGFRNYKLFYIFLWSFVIHGILTIFVIVYGFVINHTIGRILFCIVSLIYFVGVGMLVFMQLGSQVVFAARNKTWIESERNAVREALYKRANVEEVNRFDIGMWKNMKQRLGSNVLLWFVPIPNNGNPYVFEKNPKYVPIYELQYSTLANGEDLADTLMPGARMRNLV